MSSSSSSSSILNTPPDMEDAEEADGSPPSVILDVDEITSEMAARLTLALLNQMLYMKSQVPFPVTSLGRMVVPPALNHRSAEGKALQKKVNFLNAYDDLSCHLRTTFVALSAALAHDDQRYPLTHHHSHHTLKSTRRSAQIHVLIILGPSPTTGKARFLLELNGFMVEKFGERVFLARLPPQITSEQEQGQEEEESNDEDEQDKEKEAASSEDCSLASSQPLSTALDRCTPPRSWQSASDDSVPPSPPLSSSVSSSSSDDGENDQRGDTGDPQSNSISFPPTAPHLEEASIRASERLISRALFTSGDRLGFGDELAPTQTHILIHAPRRFAHPAWIPRQNLGSTMDRYVRAFEDFGKRKSGKRMNTTKQKKSAFGAGVTTVGMKVNSRAWTEEHSSVLGNEMKDNDKVRTEQEEKRGAGDANVDEGRADEENELIWWSWDGKLTGFSD